MERHELFVQKLHQCAHVFDFNDASADVGSKQIKSQTLAEMLDWITTQRGVITENIYPEVVHMASRCAEDRPSLCTDTPVLSHIVRLEPFPVDSATGEPDRRRL